MSDCEPIRCQAFQTKNEQELLELLLMVMTEQARRLKRPDLDIEAYFNQYILPMCSDSQEEETS